MYSRILKFLPFLISLCIEPTLAIENITLPEIRVVASNLPYSSDSTRNAISSITSDEIAQRMPIGVIELLQTLPGIDAKQSGGSGGRSYVSIRGGDPNFTLYIINGVKANNPTNSTGGGMDLSSIDPTMIERIDVFPGGLSSIYGSDALGGVISITTKDHGSGQPLTIGTTAGTDNSLVANFSVSSDIPDTGHTWGLSAAYRKGGDAVEGDSLLVQNVSSNLEFDLGSTARLGAYFLFTEGSASAYPEDSGGPAYAKIRETEDRDYRNFTGGIDFDLELTYDWLLTGQLSIYQSNENLNNPGIAPGVLFPVPAHSSDTDFLRNELSLSVSKQFKSFLITFGANYDQEKGGSHDIIDLGFPLESDYELSRETNSLYSEVSIDITKTITLDAAVRKEMPNSRQAENLYRLAVAYELEQFNSTIQASWNQGYKLPSLFALGNGIVGNPDLKSETSDTYEVRLISQFQKWNGKIIFSLYHSDYYELIDFDPFTYSMVNRSQVNVDGTEAGISIIPIDSLMLFSNISFDNVNILDENTQLRRRPKWKGNAGASWQANNNWHARLDAHYSGEFFDSSVPTGMIKMPSYWRLDAVANWNVTNNLDINFKIQNLLDDDFEESIGFPNPGRQAYITLNAHL
ncbi:MAG: TonB-dependent receptor [Gammaproteobacteria bacterium]|nr:TonB-dependent receptor [Gammaproteobacteria bacterium]